MKTFNVTALGPDGEVVMDKTTKSFGHPISEMFMFIHECAKALWHGEITNIAISEVKNERK